MKGDILVWQISEKSDICPTLDETPFNSICGFWPIHSILFWPPPALDPFLPTSFASVFFFSSFVVFLLFFCWPPSPTFEGVLNTPYRALLSGACFSCLLAHIFSPAWFCIKPRSTVPHVLLFTNLRTMLIFFILEVLREWITLVLCSAAIEQIRNLNLPSIDSGAEESTIYFLLQFKS